MVVVGVVNVVPKGVEATRPWQKHREMSEREGGGGVCGKGKVENQVDGPVGWGQRGGCSPENGDAGIWHSRICVWLLLLALFIEYLRVAEWFGVFFFRCS